MQNTFSQSGNDSKWFLKKSFFKIGKWQTRPPRDPPPFMANAILNFHFDFLNPSLSDILLCLNSSECPNHHSFQGFAVKGKFTQKTQFDCFRLGKVLYHVIMCGNNLSERQNVWKNMLCQQVLAVSLIHCNPLFNFPFLISKTVICSSLRFCLWTNIHD